MVSNNCEYKILSKSKLSAPVHFLVEVQFEDIWFVRLYGLFVCVCVWVGGGGRAKNNMKAFHIEKIGRYVFIWN